MGTGINMERRVVRHMERAGDLNVSPSPKPTLGIEVGIRYLLLSKRAQQSRSERPVPADGATQ